MKKLSTLLAVKRNVSIQRKLLFALLMSFVTVNIVSLTLLTIYHVPQALMLEKWIHSLWVAWPIVFGCILLIAPVLTRFVEWLIKEA